MAQALQQETLPPILHQVMEVSKGLLPMRSRLFRHYAMSTEANKHIFSVWDAQPPFEIPLSVNLTTGILPTVEALHGHRLRQLHEAEIACVGQFLTLCRADFDHQLKAQIVHLLTEWQKITCTIRELVHLGYSKVDRRNIDPEDVFRSMNLIMSQHKQQWIAIMIVALVEDRHALDSGGNVFMELFAEQWGIKYHIV